MVFQTHEQVVSHLELLQTTGLCINRYQVKVTSKLYDQYLKPDDPALANWVQQYGIEFHPDPRHGVVYPYTIFVTRLPSIEYQLPTYSVGKGTLRQRRRYEIFTGE